MLNTQEDLPYRMAIITDAIPLEGVVVAVLPTAANPLWLVDLLTAVSLLRLGMLVITTVLEVTQVTIMDENHPWAVAVRAVVTGPHHPMFLVRVVGTICGMRVQQDDARAFRMSP